METFIYILLEIFWNTSDINNNNKISNKDIKIEQNIKINNITINHKQDLFKYQWGIKDNYNNWNIRLVDYSVKRDIENRDIIDVDKVFDKYVTLINEKNRTEEKIISNGKEIKYWKVVDNNLNKTDIETVTIYFHWMWWHRNQWINDYSFWWNFNRIQNLMLKNKWMYISTDFTDFWNTWTSEMILLMNEIKKEYPNSRFILVWASSGWELLWNIINKINKTNDIKNIKWIVLLWSITTNNIEFFINKIPIFIWHWTKDWNIPYTIKFDFYNKLKKIDSKYPIKVDLFDGGVHWTPIRMSDWYFILEFIRNENNS